MLQESARIKAVLDHKILCCVRCSLLAAESYPTQIRGTAHGISAACGKV